MMARGIMATVVGLSLLFASGCPEPGTEEGGDGETSGGESGDAGGTTDDPTTGVEEGGDVNPPLDSGDEAGETETGDDESGDDESGDDAGDGGFDGPERCPDAAWRGDELPAVIFDNTIGRNDDMLASCGEGAAPDYQLDFRAPWTGTFVFDTAGSSFDSVLAVQAGACEGPELACNDDFLDLDARVIVELEQGQEVIVHVDGTSPFEQGPLKLTISEFEAPACEPIEVNPPYPKLLVDDTGMGDSQLASACGGFDSPERVYEFRAQGPGSYRFSTAGSSFDTVLYTLDPDEGCGAQPLDCNDDLQFELHSELTVELAGGERILVVVDGHDANDFGAYELLAERL